MPGRLGPPLALSVVPEMELQRAGQRARPMSSGRMHDHARRLVDDHHVLVFVEDFQRDIFGPGGLARDFGQHDRDTLARLEPIGRLAAPAIDASPRRPKSPAADALGCSRKNGSPERHPSGGRLRRRRRSIPPAEKKATWQARAFQEAKLFFRRCFRGLFLVYFLCRRFRRLFLDRLTLGVALLFRVELEVGDAGRPSLGRLFRSKVGFSPALPVKAGFGSKRANWS